MASSNPIAAIGVIFVGQHHRQESTELVVYLDLDEMAFAIVPGWKPMIIYCRT